MAGQLRRNKIGKTLTTRSNSAGGGRCIATALTILIPVLLCAQLESSGDLTQTSPNSITGISTSQDYGRLIDGVPKTSLTVCAPVGSYAVALFTNLLGGSGATYLINPGQSLTLSDIERSFWAVKGTTYSTSPVRFNLIGRTRFELKYRNTLPTALQSIYYPNQPNVQVQLPYLAFVQQVSYGRLALSSGNWTVNIDVRTRLCHSATDATISPNCAGITGQEGCADLVGQLQVARNSSNPGANCGSGACWWFDPPARYYGENYHRSWRAGTLSLTFNWNDTEGTGNLQTSPSGGAVEGVQVSLSPTPNDYFRLSGTSEVFKGLIVMRKRAFWDGSKSLDPLGFPELGENELVFRETPTGVTLETAASAWFLASPPESFLLRIPNPDGSATVISDVVEWYAWRLFWRSRISFQWYGFGYGYDHLQAFNPDHDHSGQRMRGNIFIWARARYSAPLLPDYNPNSSTNLLGSQVMEMVFRERSGSPTVVVGRARYEVFFPAKGTRHPGNNTDPYTGQRAPNWFYYYWRVVGSPNDVFFTTYNPYQDMGADPLGYYDPATNRIFIRNKKENYEETSIRLFRVGVSQCNNQSMQLIVSANDTLKARGIHAFLTTLYHERGHQWAYNTQFRSCQIPNAFFPIAGSRGRSRDQDLSHSNDPTYTIGDGLDDEWELLNGLCPYSKDTTGLFGYSPYDRLGGDAEVVAEIHAYRHLLQARGLWRHDWSDKGLQFDNPLERFPSFPWTYNSTNGNTPAHSDLLTDLPRPYGCQ